MNIKWFHTQSGLAKFIFALTVMVCSLCIFMFLGMLVGLFIFNLNFNEILSYANVNNPQGVPILKLFQFFQSVGLFIVPPIVLYSIWGIKVKQGLKLNYNFNWVMLVMVLLIMVSIIPAINYMAYYNEKMVLPQFLHGLEQWMLKAEHDAKILTTAFLNVNTVDQLLINIVIMAAIPALGEEFFFRGVMQEIFIKWTKNIHVGILIAALFFSAVHLQFYGFFPRFMLGVMFGYILVWSGSLWLTIIAHFINNAMAVIYFYFSQKYTVSNAIDSFGFTPQTRVWALVSVLLVCGLLYYFKKQSLNLSYKSI